MGVASKIVTAVLGLAGLGLVSQTPEFVQQYSQRLGGALDELHQVVNDFDQDAARSGLVRDDALEEMRSASTRFLRDRAARAFFI
jgi:hypothetical protein